MKKVQLGKLKNGRFALVDDADLRFVSRYKWHVSGGYAVSRFIDTDGKRKSLLMHRYLLGLGPRIGESEVDHINRDRLDNRKENLRVVEHWMNIHNTSETKRNKSGRKGICYCKSRTSRNRWFAGISVRGLEIRGGWFPSFSDALKKRIELEKMYVKA